MVVFYVGIVVLLIGTNLRAGGAGRGARFKKHVVEYTEGTGAESRYAVTKPHFEKKCLAYLLVLQKNLRLPKVFN